MSAVEENIEGKHFMVCFFFYIRLVLFKHFLVNLMLQSYVHLTVVN